MNSSTDITPSWLRSIFWNQKETQWWSHSFGRNRPQSPAASRVCFIYSSLNISPKPQHVVNRAYVHEHRCCYTPYPFARCILIAFSRWQPVWHSDKTTGLWDGDLLAGGPVSVGFIYFLKFPGILEYTLKSVSQIVITIFMRKKNEKKMGTYDKFGEVLISVQLSFL